MTTKTTLHVRVEPEEDFDNRIRKKLAAANASRTDALDGEPVLSVPDVATLETILGEKNLELIRTIAQEEPGSIRELSRLVERDIKNVSQAVNRLSAIGVVELVADGRAKKPRVHYDELEITYRLRDSDGQQTVTA